MPVFSKKDGRPQGLPRLFVQILVFSLLVGLSTLVLLPVQQVMQDGIRHIRDDLIGRLEAVIGRRIRYASISPSIFGAFDIRNVRILGKDDAEDVLFISRLRVTYSFLDFIRQDAGKPHPLRSVYIDRPRISLDLERDQDLLALLFPEDAGGSVSGFNLAEALPEQALFRIRGAQCVVRNQGDQFRVEEVDFDLQARDKSISLDGKWIAGISPGSVFARSPELRLNMRLTGLYSTELAGGNAVITVSSPNGQGLLKPLTFGCALQSKTLNLRKLGDDLPFDLSLDYGIQRGDLTARFNCTGFVLRELLTFSETWKTADRWLDLAVSGAASLERGPEGELRYRIDLAGGHEGSSQGAALPVAVLPSAALPVAASFVIRAGGNEEQADIEEFRVSAPSVSGGAGLFQGDIEFSGNVGLRPFAPRGLLSLKNLSFSGDQGLSAELSLNTKDGEMKALGKTAAAGQTVLSALDISLVPSAGGLGFAVSARCPPASPSGSLSLKGFVNYAPRRLEADLSLDSVSAALLAGIARPFVKGPLLPAIIRDFGSNISINAGISISTDFRKLLYDAPRIEAAFAPQPDGAHPTLLLSLSGTDQRFELRESRLVWADNAVRFSGYADYSNPLDIGFSLTSAYHELSYRLEGRILDRGQINVQGSYGFQAYLSSTEGGGYAGYIKGKDIPVPFRGQPARFTFFTPIRYTSSDFWSVDFDTFEGQNIASPAGPGYLRISGAADQDGARFPLVYYRDNISPLSGRADISWARNFSRFSGTLSLDERPGDKPPAAAASFVPAERYSLEASFAEERLNLLVSGSRMRLGRLLDNANNALADAALNITWNPERSLEAYLDLNSLSARIQGRELRASARAALNKEEFTILNLRLNAAGIEGSMPLLRINRAESIVETRADFQGTAGNEKLEGAFTVSAGFAPIASWLGIQGAFRSFNGLARVEKFQYASLSAADPFDIVFSRNDGETSISGGPRNMFRLRLARDGTFYAGLSSPFPVRGSVAGTVIDNTINASCPDLYVDLAGLWNLVPPLPDLAFTGGYVNARVEIRGHLTDPEFFGSAKGTSLRVRVPRFISQDIRPVPFTVAIEGNEMRFGPVPATVGKGAGTITGEFRFDRWIPNVFAMNITVPRETPIPFGFDITGFLAKGDISGKLRLSMAEDTVLDISGDLLANNTELGLNSDEFSFGRELFQTAHFPVRTDIKVTTGPSVEFLWPSSGFPILRANPAMGTQVHVTADSAAMQYSLTSDVKIRSGELFYFERSFYIRSGTLTFRENESRFDPHLTVRAEIRDRTDEGPVTIAMIVDDAPLLSFTPRLESTPSLSQAEIVSLLGQNLAGGTMDGSAGTLPRALLSSTSDVLAQFGVVRQVERQIRGFLHLDMFSVRTQVLQNAFFSATGLMQTPVDRNGGVGNYFDNTTIFLGKYIGSAMFVQSMLSLRYDKNLGGLRFAPDIGVELETPLFNVRWDFVPAHPENWYVNDNSITLTWRKSY